MQISESDLRGIVRDEMMRTGVSRRIREAAAAPAAGGNLAYKVKQGDTISAVLQTYYGIPLGKANYPLYNQVAKLSGIANADKILAQGDVLQLPPTLGGKPRKGSAPPAAGAPAAKGKQCNLPSYKDSLPAALGKAGIAGMAMTATITLIISGKFFNASAAGLKAIADGLRTGGQSALGALAGTAASLATFGGSEFVKNVVIGLCDGFSGIISGCVNAITAFSRTCPVVPPDGSSGSRRPAGIRWTRSSRNNSCRRRRVDKRLRRVDPGRGCCDPDSDLNRDRCCWNCAGRRWRGGLRSWSRYAGSRRCDRAGRSGDEGKS